MGEVIAFRRAILTGFMPEDRQQEAPPQFKTHDPDDVIATAKSGGPIADLPCDTEPPGAA